MAIKWTFVKGAKAKGCQSHWCYMTGAYAPGISFANEGWFNNKTIQVKEYGFIAPTLCLFEPFKSDTALQSGTDCCRYLDKFKNEKTHTSKTHKSVKGRY